MRKQQAPVEWKTNTCPPDLHRRRIEARWRDCWRLAPRLRDCWDFSRTRTTPPRRYWRVTRTPCVDCSGICRRGRWTARGKEERSPFPIHIHSIFSHQEPRVKMSLHASSTSSLNTPLTVYKRITIKLLSFILSICQYEYCQGSFV